MKYDKVGVFQSQIDRYLSVILFYVIACTVCSPPWLYDGMCTVCTKPPQEGEMSKFKNNVDVTL